jgi:hypothetical protein
MALVQGRGAISGTGLLTGRILRWFRVSHCKRQMPHICGGGGGGGGGCGGVPLLLIKPPGFQPRASTPMI